MSTEWMWIAGGLLMLVGLIGTFLPMVPGSPFVFAGIVLLAWAENFQRIGPWILAVCALLTVLTFVAEWGASLLGAKKAGASRWAMVGAFAGSIIGIFTGLIGLLFLPLIGAALGQYAHDRQFKRAAEVGVATWIGTIIGLVAEVVLVLIMIGITIIALWRPLTEFSSLMTMTPLLSV